MFVKNQAAQPAAGQALALHNHALFWREMA
jgi:hypothetical protein